MPEPQPGPDRPADGSTPVTDRERDPAVTDEPTDSVPPPAAPAPGRVATSTSASDTPPPTPADQARAAPDGSAAPAEVRAATDAVDDRTASAAVGATDDHASGTGEERDDRAGASAAEAVAAESGGTDPGSAEPPSPTEDTAAPAKPDAPTAGASARGSAAVPKAGRPTGSAPVPGRPDPTRVETRPDPTKVQTRPDPPAPRWSGSAPVPPPAPRKRGWGESAEPTPVPPPLPADSPEHQVPVDPWEGVDTTGWDLHSADFPALPPTLPYPAPPQTLPYPAPPVVPPAATARPVSPPPAPVSPPQPPAPVRAPKQRGRRTPPPVAPPPGWQPPKGYVPVPVRRRRRWPWVLLLSVACCCGVPLWWVQPLSTQYPATAALPDEAAGLRLLEDERSQAAAEELEAEVRQAHLLAEETFAGVYTSPDDKRVTVFGGTGFRLTPESDADAELARLGDRYSLESAASVDTGVRGRYERCAVGRDDGGDAVVVCTSVDHGSLTTGVFTRLNVDDSARLLDTLRRQIVTAEG